MLKILLFLFLFTQVYAQNILASHYYVHNEEIKLSDIVPKVKNDTLLYKITEGRYSKRVKSKELLAVLKKLGFKDFEAKHAYVKFEKASPIDITRIKKYVKNYYMQKYSKIDIKKVEVHPRTYIDFIGKKYIIEMPHKSELHKKGTLSIKLPNNKKIFFDFYIDATLPLYIAKKSLKRKEELSFRNTLKKSIILDKFKALPIQTIKKGTLQSKFHIQKGTVLTSRDVEIISLVKRKSTVNVTLHNSNMSISFSAQALQDGKYGDTINVRNANGKKIKVIVVGKNRVEIR